MRAKIAKLIQNWDRRFGKPHRPEILPPASSADASAMAVVSAKNSQVVAGVILGLHGPPHEGFEAAKKLMQHFVDWNELRVSRSATLVAVLGRHPRAAERIAVLHRFLEAYFLRQRSLNLDYLFTLKHHEVRRFLSELEVFDREELAAVLLSGFEQPVFPPAEPLLDVAVKLKLIRPKTTALQMAKKFETALDEDMLLPMYSHLYELVESPDKK